MGILRRVRERGEALLARYLPGRAVAFTAAIPGKQGPLCELRLEAQREPQADGARLRLRAHLHLRLRGALRRDLNSWVELRASNAALDEGSRALVPEKLEALGIAPRADKPVQTWAGALQGARPGFAMLTLLQLEKSGLPAVLRRLLGRRPFQLSATVANVVEEI